ncbi:MAG: polysaccharide pyruvyl transferase family protein [Melioribacteraceae bacterium]|nr:polysaccharide pyruvyl transferase family protein [Melioribacteraceae bacterium]
MPKATFKAVRGPLSREAIIRSGIDCPEIYGDPGILLPRYFNPDIKKSKKYGVIPHHTEYNMVSSYFKGNSNIVVINLETLDVEKTTIEILACEATISSSLHGLIISHAYGIPSTWVEFSKNLYGDGVKFQDYLESVGIKNYKPELIKHTISTETIEMLLNKEDLLPDIKLINNIQNKLLEVFPV